MINDFLHEIIDILPEELKNMIIDNDYYIDNIFCSFRRGLYKDFINPVNTHETPSGYYAYPLKYFIENLIYIGIPVENQVFYMHGNYPNWINFIKINENLIINTQSDDIEYYFCKLLGIIKDEFNLDNVKNKKQKRIINYLTCNNKYNFNELNPFDYHYFNDLSLICPYENEEYHHNIHEITGYDFNDLDFHSDDLAKLYHIILSLSLLINKDEIVSNNQYSFKYTYYMSDLFRKLGINGILSNGEHEFISSPELKSGNLLLFNEIPIIENINIPKIEFNSGYDQETIDNYKTHDVTSRFCLLYNLIANKDIENLNKIINDIKEEDLYHEGEFTELTIIGLALGINFDIIVYDIYERIETDKQLFNFYEFKSVIEHKNKSLFIYLLKKINPYAIPPFEIVEELILMNEIEFLDILLSYIHFTPSYYFELIKNINNPDILNLFKTKAIINNED